MAIACPFSRGFASRGIDLYSEFEPQPAHFAVADFCGLTPTGSFCISNPAPTR
jgi:hypothetical protein